MKRYNYVKKICVKAKAASRKTALVDSKRKNAALNAMALSLEKNIEPILRANRLDIAAAKKEGLSRAFIDRLTLDPLRIRAMAGSLSDITALKDPVGRVLETLKRPNGLVIKKVAVPIGAILIIYESRPNVTADCIGLCLKSGNSVILRGGSESIKTNLAIYNILNAVASRHGFPDGSISMIKDTDRRVVNELLAQEGLIDLVIPRGGESLIREVVERSRIPVIKHYKGVCHTYVDDSADIGMARQICFNAKVQRPGVCNAMETMLVSRRIAKKFLPSMIALFKAAGVEIRGCAETKRIAGDIKLAAESDWYEEYLDLILAIKVVKDVDEAILHIMKYGSYHSDAIVTANMAHAAKFLKEVDSACVYVNASTRFTDGGEFGKGAEIGISTDKIHARGPMGLEELTSYKYVAYGNGQIRK